jgi:predicted RNA-binding Zn-ribbon protein involved in translation (DUF1610 family)
MSKRRVSTCPLCGGFVPLEAISFRGDFDCPTCGKALRIRRNYEVAVRVACGVLGFLLAAGVGFRGLLLFCFGFMPGPFLIGPVWFAARSAYPPALVRSSPRLITLDLHHR